jgi:rhodanese-related sulfurtransferase
MNLRRHLIETATLVAVSVTVALVSNALASKERKLNLPGDYPNATSVPRPGPAEAPSAPVQADAAPSSPATAQQAPPGSSSKVNRESAAAPAKPRGSAGTAAGLSPSQKSPGDVSPAQPSASTDLLSRFPPHPDKPWVEVTGDDAAFLEARDVLFLDARRTKDYEQGHVRGARPFSIWESDIDDKVLALLREERDPTQPVVLYCSGGDCEDSHMLGQKLFGAGFNNLLVYKDGFPDWVKRGGPVGFGGRP